MYHYITYLIYITKLVIVWGHHFFYCALRTIYIRTGTACQHLFFKCRYSGRVWKELVGGILKSAFTLEWSKILEVVSQQRSSFTATEMYFLRYAFQALVHSVWRERNARRHGEQLRENKVLIKCVDKLIRLKLLAVKGRSQRYLEIALSVYLQN